MKKILSMILIAAMFLVQTGCQETPGSTEELAAKSGNQLAGKMFQANAKSTAPLFGPIPTVEGGALTRGLERTFISLQSRFGATGTDGRDYLKKTAGGDQRAAISVVKSTRHLIFNPTINALIDRIPESDVRVAQAITAQLARRGQKLQLSDSASSNSIVPNNEFATSSSGLSLAGTVTSCQVHPTLLYHAAGGHPAGCGSDEIAEAGCVAACQAVVQDWNVRTSNENARREAIETAGQLAIAGVVVGIVVLYVWSVVKLMKDVKKCMNEEYRNANPDACRKVFLVAAAAAASALSANAISSASNSTDRFSRSDLNQSFFAPSDRLAAPENKVSLDSGTIRAMSGALEKVWQGLGVVAGILITLSGFDRVGAGI
jgi:hypothetical protein